MNKIPYLYPYSMGSESARLIANAVDMWIIKRKNSRFVPSLGKVVINWGSNHIPEHILNGCFKVLNPPDKKVNATNKIKALTLMKGAGVSVPEFETDRVKAEEKNWELTVVRKTVFGKEGEGIEVVNKNNRPLPKAPLYVKYIKKESEFRIHVFCGKIIDMTKKVLRHGHEGPVNWRVRNTHNGFVFIRNGIEVPKMVQEEALKAVKSLDLDFGAVDVVWNVRQEKAYVLEVNTAPGIEGTTLARYAQAIKEFCSNG